MAKQTTDQLHAEIGLNGNFMRITSTRDGSTTDMVLVQGRNSYPGRQRWCLITHSGNVAAQVAEIDAIMGAAGTS